MSIPTDTADKDPDGCGGQGRTKEADSGQQHCVDGAGIGLPAKADVSHRS